MTDFTALCTACDSVWSASELHFPDEFAGGVIVDITRFDDGDILLSFEQLSIRPVCSDCHSKREEASND